MDVALEIALNNWKTAFRSLHYQGGPEPEDPVLERGDEPLAYLPR